MTGCGGPGGGDHRAFTTADSWYAPSAGPDGFTPLDRERVTPVVAGLQPDAQATLADVPARRIRAADAIRFAGRPLPGGGEYVLLRGVELYESGNFEIGVDGPTVRVHHGGLGHRPVPMRRKALIAVLPAVPETVVVACGMSK